ncbi:hypothetical protein BFL43_17490 [Williamsia sp. 1135]|nr:hypothetical protein BFL43_17490 [Williamsia sp. 1135]
MFQTIRRLTVFMFGAVLLAAVATGCGSDEEGSATAASSAPTAASDTSATTPATAEDSGEISEIDAEVGDCVTLGGTMMDAEIDTATCGTTDLHYVIVAKAANEADCATDIDQTYYEELGGSTTGVLCLDVDWVEGKCFEPGTGSDSTVQVPCTDPAGEKVLAVLTGTVDENECPDGTETYYTYDERQKVVCTAPAA